MINLEVFNFKGSKVRSLMVGDEPYFVGKDVAEVLGYQNTRDALIKHVDEDDRQLIQKSQFTTLEIPNRGMVVINESGLYALIFGSTLPEVQEFKHWVTSKVLPSIRKTGSYGQYQPKATSAGEVASLIKPVIGVMNKQGSRPYQVAKQVETTLNQFGIETIADFVNEPKKQVKQLSIAFIEDYE
ncbi:MAG: Bro-N domain-containing protein [Longibaculum sp.]